MLWNKLLVSLTCLGLSAYMVTGNVQLCNEGGRLTLSDPDLNGLCQALKGLCSTVTVHEHLHGDTATFASCQLASDPPYTFLINRPNSGDNTFIQVNVSDPRVTITNNGRTLQISNLQPGDEAQYRCQGESEFDQQLIGCVTVSGQARFRTCDNDGFTFRYSPAQPDQSNSCYQSVVATEGSEVVFDASLNFIGNGDCDCVEEITVTQFFRVSQHTMSLYTCNEASDSNPCNNKSEFEVQRHSMTPHNFSLVMPSANMSDNGVMFFLRIEVNQPGVQNFRSFFKVFKVTVNPAPPTTTTTITEPTTSPSLPSVVGPPVDGLQDSAGIGAGVGVPIVIILLVVIVLIIVGIILLQRRQGSENIEPKPEKQPEPLYDLPNVKTHIITDIHIEKGPPPAGTGSNRNSALYFETHASMSVSLPARNLESEDCFNA